MTYNKDLVAIYYYIHVLKIFHKTLLTSLISYGFKLENLHTSTGIPSPYLHLRVRKFHTQRNSQPELQQATYNSKMKRQGKGFPIHFNSALINVAFASEIWEIESGNYDWWGMGPR